MAYETPNAVKSVARRCNNELKSAVKSLPKGVNKDKVTRPIILKHYAPLETKGIQIGVLLWEIGVLNGVIKER